MREEYGNMWRRGGDAHVFTTNGAVKNNGECVMGRGCAREAASLWPTLPLLVGTKITEGGNHAYSFYLPPYHLFSFPVKHHWKQLADPALIERSADELVSLVDECMFERVLLPRPGCGNGGLSWTNVRQIIEPVFDDRFVVVNWVP